MRSDKKISFVLIGPEHEQVDLVTDIIRYKFPHSEIIVSTCNPYDKPERLNADKYLVNEDPGELDNGNLKNVNRNIVNSVNGILEASHPLVCRLRNDLLLLGVDFEKLLEERASKIINPKYKIFDQNIVCNDLYCVNPLGPYKLAYHFGDWFCLGSKDDLLRLFNHPLLTNEDCVTPEGQNKYRCEQVFFARLLEKYGVPRLKYDADISEEITWNHFNYFMNNFIVCQTYMNFHSTKYFIPRESGYPLMIDRPFYEHLVRHMHDQSSLL
jgi:hypothetical protein